MMSFTEDRSELLENEGDQKLDTFKVLEDKLKEDYETKLKASCLRYLLAIVIVAVLCVSIPVAFLISKNDSYSILVDQKSQLVQTNNFLMKQSENNSITIDELSRQAFSLQATINSQQNAMKVTQIAIAQLFDVHFQSYSNHSVKYANVELKDVSIVNWNLADQICKALNGQLAVPDGSMPTSISDLTASCPRVNDSCCACWVGLTREYDGKTFVTPYGNKVNLDGVFDANTGQPAPSPKDCAYYEASTKQFKTEECEGNAYQSHSKVVVAKKFVCQTLVV